MQCINLFMYLQLCVSRITGWIQLTGPVARLSHTYE